MLKLVFLSIVCGLIDAAPGYPEYPSYHDYGGGHYDPHYSHAAPILTQAVIKEPIHYAHPAPIHYAPAAPIHYAPAPAIIKTPAVYAAPTIIKAAPSIVKTYAAPATSYASVTSYHVAHAAPIVKTIVAAPQPIYTKSVIPAYAHDYGHHDDYHSYH